MRLRINGTLREVAARPETPLLWVLRDALGLTGTKYGCGAGQCGACTVHVGGRAVRSCQLPAGSLGPGDAVVTIEGLAAEGAAPHPVVAAWIELQVAQCGYCQSGQVMQAAALLDRDPPPGEDEIAAGMAGILCRCGTYPRIRAALARAREIREG